MRSGNFIASVSSISLGSSCWERAAVPRTLNEEDGDIVAHNIPVALFGVHLECEAADVSYCVSRAPAAEYGGETQEDGGLARSVVENAGVRELRDRLM